MPSRAPAAANCNSITAAARPRLRLRPALLRRSPRRSPCSSNTLIDPAASTTLDLWRGSWARRASRSRWRCHAHRHARRNRDRVRFPGGHEQRCQRSRWHVASGWHVDHQYRKRFRYVGCDRERVRYRFRQYQCPRRDSAGGRHVDCRVRTSMAGASPPRVPASWPAAARWT